ncbi:DUF732 domain-containing protein [Corynebacterium argentoratense]|uniref:DUF732 domain-containing protein n=1 Tax=Corynebacterium argentoratense TaxID=42817 RepID=UPI001F1AF6F0|nr:DUF732 domain-containing protein [Corynebacterium argentoratense]MCF1766238.1 DUF732 domain-containing protein [Corynebacterium argentoratense]
MRAPKQLVRKNAGLALAGVLLLGGLAACGFATSSSDDADPAATSSSSLARADKDASGQKSGDKSQDAKAGDSAKKDHNGGAAKSAQGGAAVNDQPAEEVSEVPSFKDDYSDEDHAYLDDLKDKGIDPKGIEAQLIGTASEVCRAKDAGGESFLVEPIAGQLVELGHTDLSLEDARTVITQAAQRAYC